MIDVLKTSALFTLFAAIMGVALIGFSFAVNQGAHAAGDALRIASTLLASG